MRFRAGGLEFNATVADTGESVSPQTGNPLRELTIQFRAQKAGMHEMAVTEALERQTGGLFSLADSGEPDLEWRVRESTWTYVGSEPYGMNHHAWRIEQVERLAITRLMLDAVALTPYEYFESVGDAGVLRLAARAVASSAEIDAIARLDGPIAVVREGISDTPRQMRLSGYVWGERPDGVAVALACEDVREPRVTLDGFAGDVSEDFADLVSLATLDVEELRRRRHARRRVSDIDAWNLLK